MFFKCDCSSQFQTQNRTLVESQTTNKLKQLKKEEEVDSSDSFVPETVSENQMFDGIQSEEDLEEQNIDLTLCPQDVEDDASCLGHTGFQNSLELGQVFAGLCVVKCGQCRTFQEVSGYHKFAWADCLLNFVLQ